MAKGARCYFYRYQTGTSRCSGDRDRVGESTRTIAATKQARHKHVPDSWVEPDYTGVVEKHTDDWINHLSSTLFAKNTRTCYKIGSRMKAVGGSKCRVTACRTQANRFFHVQCLKCLQCVYGTYGTWTEDASPMAPKRAMSLLAEFFMVEEGGEKPQT